MRRGGECVAQGPAGTNPAGPETSMAAACYAVKLVPHPQPPVAFGLVKVKPEPCIDVT